MKLRKVSMPMRLAPGSKHGLFKMDETVNDDGSATQVWTGTMSARDYVEIVPRFPLDPNPRLSIPDERPNLKHPGVRAMQETLEHEPDCFGVFNLGIDLVGDSVKFISIDKEGERQEVEFTYKALTESEQNAPKDDWPDNYGGLLNGGNTDCVLRAAHRNDPDSLNEVWVRITFFINISDELRPLISQYRNTSKSVPEYALAFEGGKFGKLQRYCTEFKLDAPFRADPRFSYNVLDVLQIISMFNTPLFPRGAPPIKAYSGLNKLVRMYDATKTGEEEYSYLYPRLADFMELYDKVNLRIEENINNEARRMGITLDNENPFRNDQMKELFPGCRQFRIPAKIVSGATVRYNIPAAYTLPVIASLRFLWKVSNDKLAWVGPNGTTSGDIFERVGRSQTDLNIDAIREICDRAPDTHMQAVGTMKSLWTSREDSVRSSDYYLKFGLDESVLSDVLVDSNKLNLSNLLKL